MSITKRFLPVFKVSFIQLLCLFKVVYAPGVSAETAFDFDGDQKADFAVRRPATYYHFTSESSDDDTQRVQFGRHEKDIPISGDFDGDGITDYGVRRPSNSTWYIRNSSGVDAITNHADGITRFQFGRLATDIPVVADYDGDGRTDIAIRRPGNQTWYIVNSTGIDALSEHADGISRVTFGRQETDIPVPADYDGDGKADLAVRRASSQFWYIKNSAGEDILTGYGDGISRIRFGMQENDIPVVADYDADGKADIAVRRPSTFQWYVRNSSGVDGLTEHADGISRVVLGRNAEDIPVIADYDGDGKADIAVRRPSSHIWYVRNSSGVDDKTQSEDGITRFRFGLESTDIPLASPLQLIWLGSDVDYDGLSNAEEAEYGTDIGLADSDNDGLSDGDEVNVYETNPTDSDSDNDGLSDGEEIGLGLDPNTPDNPNLVVNEEFFKGRSGYLSYGDRVIDGYLENSADYYIFSPDKTGLKHQADFRKPSLKNELSWSLESENDFVFSMTDELSSSIIRCNWLEHFSSGSFDRTITLQVKWACDRGLLPDDQIELQSGQTSERWDITSVSGEALGVDRQSTFTYRLILPENIAEEYGSNWVGGNVFVATRITEPESLDFIYSDTRVMDELRVTGVEGTWALPLFYKLPSGDNYWQDYEEDFYNDLVTINGSDAQAEVSASSYRVSIQEEYFELTDDNQTLRYTPLASQENSFFAVVERFVNGELVFSTAAKLAKRNETAAEFTDRLVLPHPFAYALTSESKHWLKETRQGGNIPYTSLYALSFLEDNTMRIFSYGGSIRFLVGGEGVIWQSSSELQDTLITSADPSLRLGVFWHILSISSSGQIEALEHSVRGDDANNDGELTSDELGYSDGPFIRTLEVVDMSTYSHWNILDFDGDGLDNGQEAELGTDIENPDSDGDGFTDGEEFYNGPSDPLDAESRPLLLSDISFTDPALTTCVETNMNQRGKKNMVNSLVFLDCPRAGIADISGLENLPNLWVVDFSDNNISDVSPVTSLERLGYVTFNNNQISDLSSFNGLQKLEKLFLNHNLITDVSSLNNLPELGTLHLSNNPLSDLTGLSGLPDLWELYLDNNLITNIGSLSASAQLSTLSLKNNDIGTVTGLESVETLSQLELSGNLNLDCDSVYDLEAHIPFLRIDGVDYCPGRTIDFTVIEDAALESCLRNVDPLVKNVYELDCSDSGISDLTGLEQLYQLQSLKINNNNIESLEPVAQLTQLYRLEADSNQISDVQPLALLNMFFLSLNNNQIADANGILNRTGEIVTLYLNDNLISDVSMLNNELSISRLELAGNQLIDISALAETGIHWLNLSDNNISDPSPLASLNELYELNLADNNISDISFLSEFSLLNELNVANNQITDFSPIANYSGFEKLNISGNHIIDVDFLTNYSFLRELDVSNNLIPAFPTLDLGSSGLRKLNVSSNLLTEIPETSVLTITTELYLDNNRISSMKSLTEADETTSRFRLVTLSLSNNNIAETGDFDFVELRFRNLQNLYLSGNQFTDLSDFTDLELAELDVSNNLIRDLEFSGSWLNEIKTVDLSRNRLTDLNNISQIRARNFKFGDNQISDLAGLSLAGSYRLNFETMDFSGNAIEDISVFTLENYNNLELLNFTANPDLDCSQIADVQNVYADIHIVSPEHCSAE